MNKNIPSWIEEDKQYLIEPGKSLIPSDSQQQLLEEDDYQPIYHTLQYRFKPKSIENTPGKIKIESNNNLIIEFKSQNSEESTFKGTVTQCKTDCILVFDEERNVFSLELLTNHMMDVHRSSGQISQPTQTVTEKPSAPVASPTAPLLQSVTVSKAKNTKKRRTSSSSSSETDNKEENKKKKKKPEKTKTKSKKAKEETPALDDSIEDELAKLLEDPDDQ